VKATGLCQFKLNLFAICSKTVRAIGLYPSSRILFSAVRRDIDEYVRNKWQRETDFVIEIIHRSREFLDIHVCRWMNISHDDDLLGSRVITASRLSTGVRQRAREAQDSQMELDRLNWGDPRCYSTDRPPTR
jgi:hypothetical protein